MDDSKTSYTLMSICSVHKAIFLMLDYFLDTYIVYNFKGSIHKGENHCTFALSNTNSSRFHTANTVTIYSNIEYICFVTLKQ